MEVKDIQEEVDKMIVKYGGYWRPLSMMARISEEVGELARAMNIKHGDKRSKGDGDGREIEKELADVVFTTFAIANAEDVDLEKAFRSKLDLNYEKMAEVYGDGD